MSSFCVTRGIVSAT